jgi:hypothetical protein
MLPPQVAILIRHQLGLEAHHACACEQAMVNAAGGYNGHDFDGHVVHQGEDSLQAHAWVHAHRGHLHKRERKQFNAFSHAASEALCLETSKAESFEHAAMCRRAMTCNHGSWEQGEFALPGWTPASRTSSFSFFFALTGVPSTAGYSMLQQAASAREHAHEITLHMRSQQS